MAREYFHARTRAQESSKHTKRISKYYKYQTSMIDAICSATQSPSHHILSLLKDGVLVADDLINDSFLEFSQQYRMRLYVIQQGKSRPFGMVMKSSSC